MEIWYKTNLGEVNWQEVADVLRHSGLSDHTAEEQRKAFTNSGAVVFVYDGRRIVGVARALTDGLFQAAIYKVALLPLRDNVRRLPQSFVSSASHPGLKVFPYDSPFHLFQAAIYNVALEEAYQGNGIGREMIRKLLEQLKGQNVILYTHPQTVLLYEKLGFRRAKTAMEYFDGAGDHLQWMEDEGFFLPKDYRFEEEIGRADMQGPAWKKER